MTREAHPATGSTPPQPTLAELRRSARTRLEAAGSDSPAADADALLAHALGRDRAFFLAHPEHRPPASSLARFRQLLARRLAGEPVAHLTGRRGFWSLELKVTAETLIPRPETELLVEAALARVDGDRQLRVADLGTGTGAIALALADECPAWRVTAVEASAGALVVARENARRLGLADRVQVVAGSWFGPLAGERFDLVVSNPPYVGVHEPELDEGDVRFEPRSALAAGRDGLGDLRRIVGEAPGHLVAGGWLMVEHGFQQGEAVRRLFLEAGFGGVETLRDLAGHERVTVGRLD
ncbi:peptide chain release factor N(5)-glutamine methyltransferase [Alkalilimnicola ehrlichii]|uniref:peptide chain release factor N(5)-glutamine methyltransferase n=1 Tax=Alkalilimnicola ehrlichii TaxID=351052 RepID=UPI003BA1B629